VPSKKLTKVETAVLKKYEFCCAGNATPCDCTTQPLNATNLQTKEEKEKFKDVIGKVVGGNTVAVPHFEKDKKSGNEVWLADASKCPPPPPPGSKAPPPDPNTCACFVVEYDVVHDAVSHVYSTSGEEVPRQNDPNPAKPFFKNTNYNLDITKFGYFLFCLKLGTKTVDKKEVVALVFKG
jgi:hypothetical protein